MVKATQHTEKVKHPAKLLVDQEPELTCGHRSASPTKESQVVRYIFSLLPFLPLLQVLSQDHDTVRNSEQS